MYSIKIFDAHKNLVVTGELRASDLARAIVAASENPAATESLFDSFMLQLELAINSAPIGARCHIESLP